MNRASKFRHDWPLPDFLWFSSCYFSCGLGMSALLLDCPTEKAGLTGCWQIFSCVDAHAAVCAEEVSQTASLFKAPLGTSTLAFQVGEGDIQGFRWAGLGSKGGVEVLGDGPCGGQAEAGSRGGTAKEHCDGDGGIRDEQIQQLLPLSIRIPGRLLHFLHKQAQGKSIQWFSDMVLSSTRLADSSRQSWRALQS